MNYSVGDLVEVFCRFCPFNLKNKYMVVDSVVAATRTPRAGQTDGWFGGKIVEVSDCDPRQFLLVNAPPIVRVPNSWVRVQFTDKLWADKNGHLLSEKSLFQWMEISSPDIRPVAVCAPLVCLVVRWGGKEPIDGKRFDFALSDELIQEQMDEIHAQCKNIAIYTVWVSSTHELSEISHHWARSIKCTVAMYFLWGSNSDVLPGYVLHSDLLELMHRMESVGIVTKYPNHAQLYSLITSKMYQPIVSSEMRIPECILVPVSKFVSNPAQTCREICLRLNFGVVKIGHAWMGDGVRAFEGPEDLHAKCQSLIDTGAQICSFIVQTRITDIICEPRVFVYNGEITNIRYTWNEKIDQTTGRIHALRTCPQSRAAEERFGGDSQAMNLVEEKIHTLIEKWNKWLISVSGEIPVFVRIDFLVQKNLNVWTCELGEIGSSMVGYREGKEFLFKEIAKSMIPRKPNRPPPVFTPHTTI